MKFFAVCLHYLRRGWLHLAELAHGRQSVSMKLRRLEMVLIINMIDLRSKLKSSGENLTQVLTEIKKMEVSSVEKPAATTWQGLNGSMKTVS